MKPKLADEIGINSARVLGISVLSLLASGTILGVVWGGRLIQPLEKPAQRVFLMAIGTGCLSAAGILLAGYLSQGTSRNETEREAQAEPDERDKKWEETMRFNEWYPPYMKRGIVQRECECAGCREATFWRYDYTTKHERIFFAVCSSECLDRILESGFRNPTGDIMKLLEPKKAAMKAIEREF